MMRFFAVLIAMLFVFQNHSDAQTRSCCAMNSSTEFALLGNDASFQNAHSVPEVINFTPSTGFDITFPTGDGGNGKAYLVKSEKRSMKFLFVFHEWWGLNDHIKKETERLAEELSSLEVNVIAIDLYDGKFAATAEEAGKLMQEVKQVRALAIIKGALQYAGPDAEVQSIGWCFGGGWSLQMAILARKKAKGCVMYYGMPEKDSKKLKNISAPVLGIFASKDGWINKQVVDTFKQQMKAANKSLKVKTYDADHAFANPSNPSAFDKAAAEDANKMALDFIKKNFGN